MNPARDGPGFGQRVPNAIQRILLTAGTEAQRIDFGAVPGLSIEVVRAAPAEPATEQVRVVLNENGDLNSF